MALSNRPLRVGELHLNSRIVCYWETSYCHFEGDEVQTLSYIALWSALDFPLYGRACCCLETTDPLGNDDLDNPLISMDIELASSRQPMSRVQRS